MKGNDVRGCQKVQKFPAEFGSILAFFLNTRFYFIFDSRACNGGGDLQTQIWNTCALTVDWNNKLYTRFVRYLRAQMSVGAVLWTQASHWG